MNKYAIPKLDVEAVALAATKDLKPSIVGAARLVFSPTTAIDFTHS